MTTLRRPSIAKSRTRCAALPSLLALLVVANSASAQSDVDRPLPNVLLLVDSSGSMEFRAEDNKLPVCNPGQPQLLNQKSRWIDLVEVMTGTINNYSCFPMSRSTPAFSAEYGINGVTPYDWNYINPFNRIVSGNCVIGPGQLPSAANPYEFPTHSIYKLPFNGTSVTRPTPAQYTVANTTFGPCMNGGFSQNEDGLLDVFKDKIRFGLMTFDTHVDSGTGVSGGSMNVATGFAGTWSYYLNNNPAKGRPASCLTPATEQEVGARNAAAPPWEGRMVGFGPWDDRDTDTINKHIQEVLMSTRPYGATPLAGQLKDARDFLWYDNSDDPLNPSEKFGPKNDPLTMLPECRRNLIILLSDGEPNLDLRPDCVGPDGSVVNCPFETPVQIASSLLNNPPDPDQSVETVVIGYAMPKVTPAGKQAMTCAELTDADCANNPNNRTLQACCTLNQIAAAGGKANSDGTPKTAYFPQNNKQLRRTISSILSNMTTSVTTRTSAVFASANGTGSGNYQFGAGFKPVPERPWHGKLTRTRIQCDNEGVPKAEPIAYEKGDDFAANVNSGKGPNREFMTYVPTDPTKVGNTIRPSLSTDDGLGLTTGHLVPASNVDAFVSQVPASAMALTPNSCDANNATTCRNDILGWLLGKTNSEKETRCATPGTPDCSVFGAIFYATPAYVSGPARDYLQDETYAEFARERGGTQRSSVLYAPTVDGLLHAMKTAPFSGATGAVDSAENNELWAFLPPAVLPWIKAQYPNIPKELLDGSPVVRDVPAYSFNNLFKFERRLADGKEAVGTYRTVLAAGFGKDSAAGGGYYALDVTDPDLDDGGPKFLWQLTKDNNGNSLFGAGGTPVLTTVFLKSGAEDAGSDVAVAILPGGAAGSRSGTTNVIGPTLPPKDSTFNAAPTINAYTGAEAARSLTIVRLDTGEVLRSFRAVAPAALNAARVKLTNIPAPITGRPAVFPGAVGTNADRAYVGDAEGRVWRLDLSSSDTSKWTFEVFFDLYYNKALGKRQPIELAPVVSVDEDSKVTLAVASGEQRVQTATTSMLNRVISLSETFNKDTKKFAAEVNWIQDLGCDDACGSGREAGERVTGPMEMFAGTLYFSSGIPASASSHMCTLANHRIWALDYLKSEAERQGEEADPLSGPAGKWPTASLEDVPPKSTEPQPGLVFGVAIEQQPTCSADLDNPTDDPYLGYGNYTSSSTVSPGGFSLVYQVGGVTGNTSGNVTTNRIALESPPSTVNIDSWAAVFE